MLDFATIVPQLRIKDLIFVSTFANNLRNHSTDNTIFSLGILSIKGIWMRLLRYIMVFFNHLSGFLCLSRLANFINGENSFFDVLIKKNVGPCLTLLRPQGRGGNDIFSLIS